MNTRDPGSFDTIWIPSSAEGDTVSPYRVGAMRLRLPTALVGVLLLLLGLSVAPASASTPRATLAAVPHADGARTLHLDLAGSSDGINVLPQLGCPLDPAATTFGGTVPCVWLVDQKARLTGGPAGCAPTGLAYASWRCDTRLFRDLVVDAAAAGESSVVAFNTKAAGGSGVCSPIPVALRLGAGRGSAKVADGCAERITCAEGYTGRVVVDQLDAVAGCRSVSAAVVAPGIDPSAVAAPAPAPVAVPSVPAPAAVPGTGGPGAPATGGNASGGGAGSSGGAKADGSAGSTDEERETKKPRRPVPLDLSTCRGARSGTGGDSPLYSVYIKARGRRGMTVYVSMRRAVPVVVAVRVRTRRGYDVTRTIRRCAHRGTNRFAIADATGGARSRRNYGVLVRSPNSTYPLRSSYETLPRR